MPPVMKHPQCQGCCWCAPGGRGAGTALPHAPCGTFQGAAHTGSPCHPRSHRRHTHEAGTPHSEGAVPASQRLPAHEVRAGLPAPTEIHSAPSLKPVTRTASGGGYGGVGRGIGSASSSPTYPKNLEVHLWPALNLWRTDDWPRGLGGEHRERSPEPCALAAACHHELRDLGQVPSHLHTGFLGGRCFCVPKATSSSAIS